MTKILLTGITGQVGTELEKTLAPLGEIIGVNRQTMDLGQPETIPQVIEQIKPDIIINTAAYTAVDKAETETELALTINGKSPGVMAESAAKLKIPLIHISTDYVFDGEKNLPYLEEYPTNPLGAYGKSKLVGEEAIKQTTADYLILRTAWVYGSFGGGNFVKTMLRLGSQREELRIVSDQIGSPTWAFNIALTVTELVKKILAKEDLLKQTYHFTNSGVASWYDFSVAIFEEAKELGFPLVVKKVTPITTKEYPTPAKRPPFSVLSNKKLSDVIGNYPPHWRDSLRQMLKQLYSEQS
jgi:dTDP-4-dehydrorhamnose reductase